METASTSNPSSSPIAASRRQLLRRRLRRAALTLSIVLLTFLGVALMLPVWANTEQGRAYVLERVNHHLSGNLAIAHWRLAWFHGIQMQGITLSSKDATPVLQCNSIQTDLTLWSWLWGSYDLGNTVISSPRLVATHYPDGSNDLSRILTPPPPSQPTGPADRRLAGYFASLRGSVRIDTAEVILRSASSPRQIHLLIASAEIPIASATSPIHLTIDATSQDGPASGPVSIEGTLPPLSTWSRNPAAVVSDLDISASTIPVAPLADWLGLTPTWDQALGNTIDDLSFSNHQLPNTTTSAPTFHLRSHSANIDIKCLLSSEHLTLSLPNTPGSHDYIAHASLALGRPVLDYLAYINPLLAHATPQKGTAELTLNSATIPLDHPTASSATGLLTLTNLELQPTGLVAQIYTLARGRPEKPASAPALQLRLPPTRVTLADARIACDSLTLAVPTQPRLLFSGSVGLDRSLQLLLTVPLYSPSTPQSISAGTIQIPLTGTLDTPNLDQRPLTDQH